MATTITVVCPQCDNRMRASSDYIGRKGRCPSCKALVDIRVPHGDSSLATTYAVPGNREDHARHNPTEVANWKACLGGVLATLILYAGLMPFHATYVGQLFVHRGTIPYLVVLITCWGVSLLVLKFFAVKRQQGFAELELELIPLEIGLQITPTNVDQFLAHLAKASPAQRYSILGKRIHGALDHFRSRHSVPEVQDYLAAQAELDASSVDAGYTLLRSFIWAVPILGFIGTVIGISAAVSELSTTLASGGEIKAGLDGITGGLSTAFDTTLIALSMAILLLFPTESLRKNEYQMLDRIETFANEQLLRRMSDARDSTDLENMPDIVKDTLTSAFQEHQRWLVTWQSQVAELGRVVGGDFEQVFTRMQQQVAESENAKMERLNDVGRMLSDIFERMLGATQSWQRAEEHILSRSNDLLAAVNQMESNVSEMSGYSQSPVDLQADPDPNRTKAVEREGSRSGMGFFRRRKN